MGCALSSDANQREADSEKPDASQAEQPTDAPASIDPGATDPEQPATAQDQQTTHDLGEFLIERLLDPVTWFTGGLLWLAVLQYRAMRKQATYMREQADYMRDGLVETKKTADAAKQSANVARDQVQLLAATHLDVEKPKAEISTDADGRTVIKVGYRLTNLSANIATAVTVGTMHVIPRPGGKPVRRNKFFHLMSPGKGLYLWGTVGPLNEADLDALGRNAFYVDINMLVHWFDPLNRERQERFLRTVVIGRSGVVNSIYVPPEALAFGGAEEG